MLLWCLYCSLWTDFTHLSGVSDVEFKKGKYEVGICIAQYSDGT